MYEAFSRFANQTWCLVTCVFLVCLNYVSVFGQPLQLPPESFPCGSSNIRCQRWGYDTCISKDDEHYCLPCSHDYLKTLCGTKDEIQGCNLFCEDAARAAERAKLQFEFLKEQTELLSNFSREKEQLERKLKYQETEKTVLENNTKLLEGELIEKAKYIKHQQDLILAISTILGILALLYVALICFIYLRHRLRCRSKKSIDSENRDFNSPLLQNTEERSVQTDGNFDETEQRRNADQDLSETAERCPEDFCPGLAMLQNVPPTNEDGRAEMAIYGCPQQSRLQHLRY